MILKSFSICCLVWVLLVFTLCIDNLRVLHLERDQSPTQRSLGRAVGGNLPGKSKVNLGKQLSLFCMQCSLQPCWSRSSNWRMLTGRSQVNLKPSSRICSGKNVGLEMRQNLDLNSRLSIVSGAIVTLFFFSPAYDKGTDIYLPLAYN